MSLSFPYFMARRYLFAKKKHGSVNIISAISACGVALATLALVCTLSVFNGFQEMVAGFFTAFDAELKIVPVEGKFFDPRESRIQRVKALPSIDVWSATIEEHAVVKYKERQTMVTVKGVEENFEQLTQIDSLIYGSGSYLLQDEQWYYGILGVDLLGELGCGMQFVDPLQLFAPKRGVKVNIANPQQ